ncbi:uracil-xanthine permease family protein [Kiloniella laminariae]|uniref:uracil-xanthine permease family protein n=1 Tax=Kiloniella laminariae TaxID=454162 RepID=UPI00037500E6|nr:solute carrier family 23 protein [Kiloniella laminariae]
MTNSNTTNAVNNGAVLDVEDKPPFKLWGLLSLQHLCAMFGATVLVPYLVTSGILANDPDATGLSTAIALITSGGGTLLYLCITGFRIPAYLGSSFAFIAPLISAAVAAGLPGAMFGAFCAGLVYLVVAILIRFFGVNWLMKILPPVVVGPVIMVIGLGLAPIAIGMATKGAGGDYSALNLTVALFTLVMTLLFSLVFRGIISIIPILLGIICGYVLAFALGMVDFATVASSDWIAIPDFTFFPTVFAEGLPWFVLPLLVPVALVTIAEHIGDQMVLSRVVGRNFLRKPGLDRSLAGDGLATLFASLLGGPPNTTYGENIGVLAITRIYSVYVIAGAAVLALSLGFIGKISALVSSIPVPVMGGIAIALFGVIASSGLRTLIEGKVDLNEKRNLLITSVILVLGIGGAELPIGQWATLSSMAFATLAGITMHLTLPGKETAGDSVKSLG